MKTRILAAAAVAVLLSAGPISKAAAAVIYDWTGTCFKGCTGNATMVLTLEDTYTPGTQLQSADFVSAAFTVNTSFDFDLELTGGTLAGILPPVSGPSLAPVEIGDVGGLGMNEAFNCTGVAGANEWCAIAVSFGGSNSSWVLRTQAGSVPEPAVLILFALGLVGIGYRRLLH